MTFKRISLLIVTALILGLSVPAPAVTRNHRTHNSYNSYESYHSTSERPENIFNPKLKQYDACLAISPHTVQYNLEQKQKITLIDVRNPKDFARLHVPGSINIPLHAVKTKFVLKSFLIVFLEPAAWFLLWEGSDLILFSSREINPELNFYKKMLASRDNIVFKSY